MVEMCVVKLNFYADPFNKIVLLFGKNNNFVVIAKSTSKQVSVR